MYATLSPVQLEVSIEQFIDVEEALGTILTGVKHLWKAFVKLCVYILFNKYLFVVILTCTVESVMLFYGMSQY